jgi:hypothetical protein
MGIGLRNWSTTTANNASLTGSADAINWKEGQAPSTVNNSARETLSQIRAAFEDLSGGWFDYGDTPGTRNGTEFSLAGDVSATYELGRRLRIKGGSMGTVYGEISSVSVSGGNTIVGAAMTPTISLSGTMSEVALGFDRGAISNNVKIADGDTAAGDNAAIGYTAAEGLILAGQGSTNDITIKNDADTNILEIATGATDVEISAGNILFGTASKGVYLGVTTATAANLLEDYEEGSYTATLVTSTSGGYNLDSNYDLLSYTKIGRMVHVYGRIDIDSDDSPDGQLQLSLPFTAAALAEWSSTSHNTGVHFDAHGDASADNEIVGYIENSATRILFYETVVGTGVQSYLLHNEVDPAFHISVNFSYLV